MTHDNDIETKDIQPNPPQDWVEKFARGLSAHYEDIRNLEMFQKNMFARVIAGYRKEFERLNLTSAEVYGAMKLCLHDTKRQRKEKAPNVTELLIYINLVKQYASSASCSVKPQAERRDTKVMEFKDEMVSLLHDKFPEEPDEELRQVGWKLFLNKFNEKFSNNPDKFWEAAEFTKNEIQHGSAFSDASCRLSH